MTLARGDGGVGRAGVPPTRQVCPQGRPGRQIWPPVNHIKI